MAQVSFSFGQVVMTPGALEALALSGETPLPFLARHAGGDWGDLEDNDKRANDKALVHGGRLLSAYHTTRGEKIWIITEADRSSTCILLPSEY